MKLYIAYRYTGADKTALKSFLLSVSSVLEAKGHKTFIFFRDAGKWENREEALPLDQVMKGAFREIDKADAVLVLLTSNDKSEGMLLEIGYALAKKKPLYLALKEGFDSPKTRVLATHLLRFKDENELTSQLSQL